MSNPDELFDLSLFAESPTFDHHFSIPRTTRSQHREEFQPPRLYQPTLPREYQNKPLPPLPQRRLRARGCDVESRCILRRIQRIGSNEQSHRQRDTLLQRRNPNSPPQLMLSVPQSQPQNRQPASAMIWMPEEQMWLISGESAQQDVTFQNPYPSPPPYSPRDYTRSEPSPNIPPPFDLTPPLTPVQHQFQTLMQRPHEPFTNLTTDSTTEERMSPAFQEAMNSVPMMDPTELFLPSLSINTNITSHPDNQNLRPQTALERSASAVSPPSPRPNRPVRSVSAGSRSSYNYRSDSSDTRSFYSAVSVDLTQSTNSASRWAGLAQRIARPASGVE